MKIGKLWRVTLGLIVAALLFALPSYFKNPYLIYVMDTGLVYALMVLGLVVLVGFTGLLSLGQAAFYAIGAYTSALLVLRLHAPVWIGVLGATIFSGAWGVLVGLPSFKLEGPFLVIITIGFAEIIRLITLNAQALTGGPFGLSQIPPLPIGQFLLNTPQSFYYFILALNLIVALSVGRLRDSRVGRAMRAIRDDELAAWSMGINARTYKVMAFALSAMLAGLSGAMYGHLTSYLNPDLFTFDASARVLTMNVVGGIESYLGAIVSSVVVTIMPETLRFLKDFYMLIFSLVLILLVLFTAWLENIRNSPDAGGNLGEWIRGFGNKKDAAERRD